MPSTKSLHWTLFPQEDYQCKSKVKATLIQNLIRRLSKYLVIEKFGHLKQLLVDDQLTKNIIFSFKNQRFISDFINSFDYY